MLTTWEACKHISQTIELSPLVDIKSRYLAVVVNNALASFKPPPEPNEHAPNPRNAVKLRLKVLMETFTLTTAHY